MTDSTELAQRARINAECGEHLSPAETMELVEALESEKRICATWRKTAKSTGEKLEKAQTINAAAEKLVRCKGRYHSEQNYRALAALFGVKTPDLPPLEHENVHYADAAEMEIAALRQRIAELESRTVKLPDDEDGQAYGFGKWANGKLPATAGTMTFAYCEDAWRAAFEVFSSTAGIKVEADSLDADVNDRNQPGMVVAVHIDVGDFVKFRGRVYEVKETDFDDHDVTLWFVCGEVLKCAAGCPIEVVSAPVEDE